MNDSRLFPGFHAEDVSTTGATIRTLQAGPHATRDLSLLYFQGAIVALTESLALELAPEVLVNAAAPGPILMPPGLSPAENDEVVDATPLRRWGGPEEIAKTVLFLVETDFVTGECIRVDGGRHLY